MRNKIHCWVTLQRTAFSGRLGTTTSLSGTGITRLLEQSVWRTFSQGATPGCQPHLHIMAPSAFDYVRTRGIYLEVCQYSSRRHWNSWQGKAMYEELCYLGAWEPTCAPVPTPTPSSLILSETLSDSALTSLAAKSLILCSKWKGKKRQIFSAFEMSSEFHRTLKEKSSFFFF